MFFCSFHNTSYNTGSFHQNRNFCSGNSLWWSLEKQPLQTLFYFSNSFLFNSCCRQAVLKYTAKLEKQEHSDADPPSWLGYDWDGNILTFTQTHALEPEQTNSSNWKMKKLCNIFSSSRALTRAQKNTLLFLLRLIILDKRLFVALGRKHHRSFSQSASKQGSRAETALLTFRSRFELSSSSNNEKLL